ncbi:MAG TPA: DUF1343 domain-containing protein, partial [Saprospiraceae bacterium]|nr:DUF1343 domain-containing protein [Saprospiraceae bacterium]
QESNIQLGAEQTELYMPLCRHKKLAIVANAATRIGSTHLVDSLLKRNLKITAILTPEHGFEGKMSAGEQVDHGQYLDIPVYSLYGSTKKPTSDMLKGVDVLLFDLQDVGVRFYTYLSTLHYVMEACAEEGIEMIVLDRPNPNDGIIDGPVLDTAFSSFVGLHPVPLLYGMTIAEYAMMIHGESWINEASELELMVVPLGNYHRQDYTLPHPPSPNLPNHNAVKLYPHLCLFEATTVSVGRGTDRPFQLLAHPNFENTLVRVTPQSCAAAKYPKLMGQECGAVLLNYQRDIEKKTLDLRLLLKYHAFMGNRGWELINRPDFFDLLAGTDELRHAIERGDSWLEIRQSWQSDLAQFKRLRSRYVLYAGE